jgi:DNA processing protein
LSRSVLIVEAPKRSGSLITGSFALDQGKDLWVASAGLCEGHHGMLYDKTGTIKLGNDGAEVIHCADDVFKIWGIGDLYIDDTMIPVENNDNCSMVSSQRKLVTSMASYLEVEL